MRENYRNRLREMAELAIQRGIALKPGQRVAISAPVETHAFVALLEELAYANGARSVSVRWEDSALNRAKACYAPQEELEAFPIWEIQGMQETADENGCFISVRSPSYHEYDGVPAERAELLKRAERQAMQNIMKKRMDAICTWTVVLLPNLDWAKTVYLELEPEDALERLAETLLDCAHIQEEGTVAFWDDYREQLEKRARFLTEKKIRRLHYKNGRGTDFTVALAKDNIWCGGGVYSVNGEPFIPNIPTEEIATAPDCRTASGTVAATMPFLFEGSIIEGMVLEFEEGKVVRCEAEGGKEALSSLLEADQNGASRCLGEVALVPYSSPISKLHTLFYNTLLDENASCHLALGRGYAMCLKKGAKLSEEEMVESGLNTGASVHVDFMIGSSDLQVTGETESGETVEILRDGEWAFAV